MASCNSCGAQVSDCVKFCTACGTPVQTQQPQPVQPVNQAPPADPRPAKGSAYAPIGTIGYIGYFILFAIPILGLVLCILWAFWKKEGTANRRSFARAMFVMLVVAIIAATAFGITVNAALKNANIAGVEGGLFSWAQAIAQGGTADNRNNASENGSGQSPANTKAPMEYSSGDGTVFTAQWPDNEFTRQVPKPNFEVAVGTVSKTEYVALGSGATLKNLREYAQQLRRKGFDKNAETIDESALGITQYSYKAKNGKGYEVEISYVSMMTVNTITIRKVA